MPKDIRAGQKVKKNRSPGPMGLGFGSGQRPMVASRAMVQRGPPAEDEEDSPIFTQIFSRHFFIYAARQLNEFTIGAGRLSFM
jgi:hypothetical protein